MFRQDNVGAYKLDGICRPESQMPRSCRDRNKNDGNNNQMDGQREEDHIVEVAIIAAVAVVKRPGCHFSSSGGSVIIPSLSTPALRTSDMTSTTNP